MSMSKFGISGALLAAVLVAGALPDGARAAAAGPEALARAQQELRDSDAEWKREEQAYRTRRKAGAMGKAEADEYAAFVASLHRRKLENCEAVRRLGGNAALDGFDCVQPKSGSEGAEIKAAPDAASVRTEGEKTGDLDSELKKLEAELDETLLKRQEELRNKAEGATAGGSQGGGASGGQGSGTGSGGGVSPGGASGGTGMGRASSQGTARQQTSRGGQERPGGNTASGAWGDPDSGRRRSSTGEPGQPGTPRTPSQEGETGPATGSPGGKSTDMGAAPGDERTRETAAAAGGGPETGDDDDIVLRQIREAAERETDPVMKEKLWEEYRKLKERRQKEKNP